MTDIAKQLAFQLRAAANYIEALGGVSTSYRQALAAYEAQAADPLWNDSPLDKVKARLQRLDVDDLRGFVVSLMITLRIERKAQVAVAVAQAEPLSSEEIENAIDQAANSMRAWCARSGARGQMVMQQDSVDWHLARAIEDACTKKWGVKLAGIGASSGRNGNG